jgi:hypothetical protein
MVMTISASFDSRLKISTSKKTNVDNKTRFRYLDSAHPEMANFRNIGVGLRILILTILNVWMPVPMFFYRGG